MEKYPVKLYVYDVSRGLARQMSPLLLGKRIEGIWHTALVCYDREYFYGGGGIESCLPGGTMLGSPDEIIDLGETEITQDVFMDFLGGIGCQDFRPEKYHLFEHNRNTFSAEASMFLTGNRIPQYIQDLPSEVLNTSLGQMIKPLVDSMSLRPTGGTSVSDLGSSSRGSQEPEAIFEPRETPPGQAPARDPPDGCQSAMLRKAIIFDHADVSSAITQLRECLQEEKFCEEDLNLLDEVKSCCDNDNKEGVQDRVFEFIDTVMETYLSMQDHPALCLALQLLQVLVLSERLVDRSYGLREVVQKVCRNFSEMTSKARQVEAIKLFCCVVSHKAGHSAMLKNPTRLPSVTVNSLLSKDDDIVSLGAALATNIARYKTHEEIALECSTAVIEVMRNVISPETAHNCLFALRRFVEHNSEVAGLASVMGVDVSRFKGISKEVDDLCNDLEKLLS